jgi:DNA helicase-2/ATP-dependent DNA helicase PcrA
MCLECGKPLQTSADKARRRCVDCPAPYDEELFERLRQWRSDRAREEEIAAFMVFSNATLEEIAIRRPQSSRELLKVSGVGKEKLHKYGEELLGLVS